MQSRPESTEAAFSSNTTWAGRTRSLQQRHVTLQPGHSPRPPGLCLGEAAWPSRVPQGLSLVNPTDWPRRAGRNSHWEQMRREPQGGCARHGPALPAALAGARAHLQGPSCPCAQGPAQERSSLPQPFSSRDPGSLPCPLGRGRYLLSFPVRHLPLSEKTEKPPHPCPPGKALRNAHVCRHSGRGSQPPSLPWPAGGGQRAQGTQHLAGNTEGRRACEPTAPPPPRCQRCPHTKAGGQHAGGRSAARVPRRRNRPRPLPHPQPPSLPECQGPRNHVSSSQGGWPPRVRGLPGGASMPGHLRRRWTRLARRPLKGGGAARGARARLPSAAGTGRPDSWAGGSDHSACSQAGGRREAGGGRSAAPPQETGCSRGRLGRGGGGTGTQLAAAGGQGGRRPGQGPSRLATFT